MNRWEFLIDVGGTFTDCLAYSPDRRLLTCKVLSSGATKGIVERREGEAAIVDTARRADPARFWTGYEARFLDRSGKLVHRSRVANFDQTTGLLTFDERLPEWMADGCATSWPPMKRPPCWPFAGFSAWNAHNRCPPFRLSWGPRQARTPSSTRKRRTNRVHYHAGLRRCIIDRLPGPAAPVRSGDPQARPSLRGRRDRRADRRGRHVLREPRLEVIPRSNSSGCRQRGSIPGYLPLAFVCQSNARGAGGADPREIGFTEVSTSSRLAP